MTQAAMKTTPRDQFLRGVKDQLPILLGVVPFGLIFGALAIGVGLAPSAAQGFSVILFAGSAQFIAVQLIGGGVPPAIIVLSIFIVNLRHALYSATLSPHLRTLPARWRWALGWLLTDEAFATTSMHFRRNWNANAHWYFFGTGLTLWGSWQISTAIGIALGAAVPPSWDLDFALPLTFIALVIPSLVDRPTAFAAAGAGLSAVAFAWLPYRLGLLVGALVGILIGLLTEAELGVGEGHR